MKASQLKQLIIEVRVTQGYKKELVGQTDVVVIVVLHYSQHRSHEPEDRSNWSAIGSAQMIDSTEDVNAKAKRGRHREAVPMVSAMDDRGGVNKDCSGLPIRGRINGNCWF